MPRARSISESGTFGLPSGKRSKGFCAVSSISCSLVMVNNCARPIAGATNDATARKAANCRFMIDLSSTPLPVIGPVDVPLRSGLEIPGLQQVLLDDVFVQCDAEPRFIRHRDEAFVDDRFFDA